MIPLRIGEIFFLYLFLFLAVLFVVWMSFEHGHRSKRYEPPVAKGYRCPICSYTYTADRDEPVHRCPRCGSYQE
jgi:rubrerythrin